MLPSNDPARKSWVNVPAGSDFPIQNLPFGVFTTAAFEFPHIGVAIGEEILDIHYLADKALIDIEDFPSEVLLEPNLNKFASLGRGVCRQLREWVSELLLEGDMRLSGTVGEHALYRQDAVEMCLPFAIRGYTDFYSSIEHATNVGIMFRGKDNALMPNWKHLPVGYHGRASSIVISGTDIKRPHGQMLPAPDATQPVYGPSKLLDFELEVAFAVGAGNALGTPIPLEETEAHIFGLMLFNDWSARDIQSWEYVPLGPFLGKNFASSVSPWVVTLDALEPFRVAGPVQDPTPLPYLQGSGPANFDIQLEVLLQPSGGVAHTICRSNFKYMYWSMQQQLAHHTVNGCNMEAGDLCASGTISGPTPDSFGSMLELSWRGSRPVSLGDGGERRFILDGDTVIMKGYCEGDGVRIGFGEVRGRIVG
jgi:fumarylacetoacetase